VATSPAEANSDAAARPAIDEPVCLAFQLGWDMSCLYHQARTRARVPKFTIARDGDRKKLYPKLPAQSDFNGSQRTARRLTAVGAGLFRLTPAFERAGFQRPSTDEVRIAFEVEGGRDALKERIFHLHTTVLVRLQAADARLGSAYNLGRALVATRECGTATELRSQFRAQRINGLRDELDDLVSALPVHAGHAVSMSLCWWQCALAPRLKGSKDDGQVRLAKGLRRQADLWRALLSGEKRGADMLRAEDYTAAANRLLDHAASIAAVVLRTHWRRLALGCAAIIVAIALAIGFGGVAGTVAGIGAAAAAFGISWKGIGTTVTGLADQLRAPLWRAELDLAIAKAITDKSVRSAYAKLPARERHCNSLAGNS
jgi:hypothetical protein